MAIGAVLFSVPMALFFAIYGYAADSVTAPQGLLVYSAMGTGILLSFTLLNGLRFGDVR